MDKMETARLFERLNQRREQIETTLRHLKNEQQQAEENSEWLDQAAHQSRIDLLDRLTDWYRAEIRHIDHALRRIGELSYGQCMACHQVIEVKRLEAVPEADFCAECQAMREEVARV
jgi:RNA polymerase-binding transcription factor DksA